MIDINAKVYERTDTDNQLTNKNKNNGFSPKF
jgi:hypothetical protein